MLDIKSKKFSHSFFIKTIIFILMIASVAGAMYTAINIYKATDGNLEIMMEKSYLESTEFRLDYDYTVNRLANLVDFYVSEEYILAGKTIDQYDIENRIENYYWDEEHLLDDKEMQEKAKQELIEEELARFQDILYELKEKEGLLYYVTDGKHTYTNTNQTKKEQFKSYPVYYISEGNDNEIYPRSLTERDYFYGDTDIYRESDPDKTKLFAGYTEEYLTSVSNEWTAVKEKTMQAFYNLLACIGVFLFGLLYLMITTGRHSFRDQTVYLHGIDKLYVDLNLAILAVVAFSWLVFGYEWSGFSLMLYPVTLALISIAMLLFLSLVRLAKNKTFFKHTLLYTVFRTLYRFLKEVYDSGSVGMKIIVIVIFYPVITVASLIFFPITIAVAAWLALKKVKEFKAIQEGTKMMRDGNLQHHIEITGEGEFATLAANINSINEGFKQAVHNELKNERMKTELITNVSHDIRTPLTSLITYTDLLKTETNPDKIREYVEILEQKSKRLKVLTDDLFAAAKASSGDIPVEISQIDVVALINQGIGEVSEQIAAKGLIFKSQFAAEKMEVMADGKLLWRSIENILSNIFNYALEGSRVYIDITDENDRILISFKNISKYELNISEEELMERFKRGDESRTSQGSGLGLSITKSLIENQGGTFNIDIDGDLFKSMIYLQKGEPSA